MYSMSQSSLVLLREIRTVSLQDLWKINITAQHNTMVLVPLVTQRGLSDKSAVCMDQSIQKHHEIEQMETFSRPMRSREVYRGIL